MGSQESHQLLFFGEMAERLNAAVLKTVLVKANGGSNPSLSASDVFSRARSGFFLYLEII